MGVSERLIEAIQAGKVQSREVLANAAGVEVPTLVSALGALRRAGKIEFDKPSRTQIDYPSIRVVGAAPKRAVVRRDMKPEKAAEPALVVEAPIHRAYVDTAGLSRVRELLIQAADELGTIVGGALAPAEYLRALASQLEVAPSPTVTMKVNIEAPAPRVARKPRKTKDEVKPRYKTVAWNSQTHHGRDLAEFCTLADAEKALSIDLRAQKIVDIETGEVVKQKRSKLVPEPRVQSDEEE